jgi:hypothetical protein
MLVLAEHLADLRQPWCELDPATTLLDTGLSDLVPFLYGLWQSSRDTVFGGDLMSSGSSVVMA